MKTGTLSKKLDELQELSTKRDYIGASVIGKPCLRSIWYSIKHPLRIKRSAKIERTFGIGRALEDYLFDLLQIKYPELKKGEKFWSSFNEIPGTPDAFCDLGVIEIKTMNNSNFNQFVKHGIKKSHPHYYIQVQCYLGMTGCYVGYLLAINKDNSSVHDEQILFDHEIYSSCLTKARTIMAAVEPPPQVSSSPLYFLCKTCEYKDICHGN